MMTYTDILTMANALGNDAYVTANDTQIMIDFNDFDGFDNDWNENFRDYDNADAVDSFIDMLTTNANTIENGFYTVYHFDGFVVSTGYTSFDI